MTALTCPSCGAFLADTGTFTSGAYHARHQRTACQCGAKLVRHADLAYDQFAFPGIVAGAAVGIALWIVIVGVLLLLLGVVH